MSIPRRTILKLAAAPAAALMTRMVPAHAATFLQIFHQFPGGSIDQGDFRDRLCRKFAAEVTKATGGELEFQIYPGSSMMKTNAQFSALRKGALDLSLFPISYAGGEVKELNIGLMPALRLLLRAGSPLENGQGGAGDYPHPQRQGCRNRLLGLAGRRPRLARRTDRRSG